MNKAPLYFADIRAGMDELSSQLTARGWEHKVYCTKSPGWKVYYINVTIPKNALPYKDDLVTEFLAMCIKTMGSFKAYSKQLNSLKMFKQNSRMFKMRLSYTEKEYDRSIMEKLEEL